MKEQLISFETAKLAKEKGFKMTFRMGFVTRLYHPRTRTLLYYGRTGKVNINMTYYASTQSLLQKWLREEHNIHIVIDVVLEAKWHWTVRNLNKATAIIQDYKEWVDGKYTYEETLEKGLQEALKLIK